MVYAFQQATIRCDGSVESKAGTVCNMESSFPSGEDVLFVDMRTRCLIVAHPFRKDKTRSWRISNMICNVMVMGKNWVWLFHEPRTRSHHRSRNEYPRAKASEGLRVHLWKSACGRPTYVNWSQRKRRCIACWHAYLRRCVLKSSVYANPELLCWSSC